MIACAYVAAGVTTWKLTHPTHPAVELIDVGARAWAIEQGSPNGTDVIDRYYVGDTGQAHLHTLRKHSVVPLHIHERTDEATVPITGRPHVTQLYGAGSEIARRDAEYGEGALVLSPRLCGHEWGNPSASELQSNLVFTVGEAFPGNLFVDPTDPRIKRGGAPVAIDVDAELLRFTRDPDAERRIDLPVTPGAITVRLVKDRATVETRGYAATLVYAARGRGALDGLPQAVRLSPGVLAVLRVQATVTARADPEHPLALYVVQLPK